MTKGERILSPDVSRNIRHAQELADWATEAVGVDGMTRVAFTPTTHLSVSRGGRVVADYDRAQFSGLPDSKKKLRSLVEVPSLVAVTYVLTYKPIGPEEIDDFTDHNPAVSVRYVAVPETVGPVGAGLFRLPFAEFSISQDGVIEYYMGSARQATEPEDLIVLTDRLNTYTGQRPHVPRFDGFDFGVSL